MEHSTSAVQWQPVNPPKAPGQLRRDSLTHVAYGSDAVSFFQWRASLAGAEKFHSAMVPHAGANSRLWADVCRLGADVAALAEVVGTQAIPAKVALLYDWTSAWAHLQSAHPSNEVHYRATATQWWNAFHALGIAVDVLPADADFSSYAMVLAPLLLVVDEDRKQRLTSYVNGGGHLVTSYFSGIVDDDLHVHLGGYPGALRDLLGVRVEEFGPMLARDSVALAGGGSASVWAEQVDVLDDTVKVVESYASGDLAGQPAVTRRAEGTGSASYLSGSFDSSALTRLFGLLASAGDVVAELEPTARGAITKRERGDETRRFVFFINHTRSAQQVATEDGVDVLTGATVSGKLTLDPLGVAVIRTA
jgi:beta-galactosidase